jgi:predicted GIY-YIG superfamily endonuclease
LQATASARDSGKGCPREQERGTADFALNELRLAIRYSLTRSGSRFGSDGERSLSQAHSDWQELQQEYGRSRRNWRDSTQNDTGELFAPCCVVGQPKRFVYLLRSLRRPDRPYTGITSNVAARLNDHNSGLCRFTAADRPWQLRVAIEFVEEAPAVAFEKYLKTGSGRAFSKRHFR